MADYLNAGGNMSPTPARRRAYEQAEIRKLWMAVRGTKQIIVEDPVYDLDFLASVTTYPREVGYFLSDGVSAYSFYPSVGVPAYTVEVDPPVPDITPTDQASSALRADEYNMILNGDYVYLFWAASTSQDAKLRYASKATPGSISLLGQLTLTPADLPGGYHTSAPFEQMQIDGDYLYVAYGEYISGTPANGGIAKYDISTPGSPSYVGNYRFATYAASNFQFRNFFVRGDYIYIIQERLTGSPNQGHMRVYDASVLGTLTLEDDTFVNNTYLGQPRGIRAVGDKLYVKTDYGSQKGVAFDISDPTAPSLDLEHTDESDVLPHETVTLPLSGLEAKVVRTFDVDGYFLRASIYTAANGSTPMTLVATADSENYGVTSSNSTLRSFFPIAYDGVEYVVALTERNPGSTGRLVWFEVSVT